MDNKTKKELSNIAENLLTTATKLLGFVKKEKAKLEKKEKKKVK